ncbi:Transcriptional regulatory protein, C terminal [Promicromonospora umidemergens]|uniref:OmpR/PhoB-type domain-containing protein n=1 Tax=Promicromonospora umidemergens TaxID=629679 RepID=A0ABP8XUX0_9MICO|nr:winged helix-turn-helix domain-containing protein [Promicromonospora umidemergens]MCP2286386.1 Transcriptional regulatory protein, C terminal [Promicromonospora umidemergens]
MTIDPAPGSAPGLVVCVGLPPDQIIEIAHLLRGRATVLATPDAEGARAVLDNQAAPRPGGTAAWRGLGAQAERYDNPGPGDDHAYGRHLPEHPVDRYTERVPEPDNLTEAARAAAAEPPPTALSSVARRRSPGMPDAGAGGRSGRFRPASGSVLAQPVLHATVSAPPRPGAGTAGTGAQDPRAGLGRGPRAVRADTGAVPTVTGPVPMIAPPILQPLVAGPLLVDLAGREVTALGRRVYLSAREFDLLATLALEAGRVWSFAELTARVWQLPYLGDSDPVTSAVKRLRKRLSPVRDVEVASVRGVGYRLKVRIQAAP